MAHPTDVFDLRRELIEVRDFFSTLFSKTGLFMVIYILIGFAVAGSTFPSHSAVNGSTAHAWIQFVITLFMWPLALAFPNTTFHF